MSSRNFADRTLETIARVGPWLVRWKPLRLAIVAWVRRRLAQWAWVRALAAMAIAALAPLASGCSAPPAVPPMPDDPAGWIAEADEAVWSGELPGPMRARFEARRAVVEWKDGAPDGRFEGIDLHLWTASGEPVGHIWAKSGTGTWPDGPLAMSLVGWELQRPPARGSLDEITWAPGGRWSCGGCPLEGLLP